MSIEKIRVQLEDFCRRLTSELEPFDGALAECTRALRDGAEDGPVRSVLNDLQDNQHRLKILLDRAQQQHTYLVIFGPLKSGKSTLMNAISGAYVSEVSSLPAYPCLVYVREGDSRGFSTTAFNGDRLEYASREELQGTLERAHSALAKRIREADKGSRPFNPGQDFGEAIRRIDFTMPAPYLRESGTILVDTPGLYTKMKYNYGQLTRDFRNNAACAVFVVKTDNLFFEPVFEEFTDLLDVFSRVFLVVNIDSSKRDLGPNGTLEPALEQHDPQQIIKAFENLTVNSQIRSAIDAGRLRIYTIDLLRAGAQSLRNEAVEEMPEKKEPVPAEDAIAIQTDHAGEDAESQTEPPAWEQAFTIRQDEKTAVIPAEADSQVGFGAFLRDLSAYLNSSEYIIEFMTDSLRQARSILAEVRGLITAQATTDFRTETGNIGNQLARAERQLEELDALREHKWDETLETMAREIVQQVREHAASVLPELKSRLAEATDAWRETGESVRDLLEVRLRPILEKACTVSRQRTIGLIDGACTKRDSGLSLSQEIVRRMDSLDLSLDSIYPEFQPTVRKRLEASPHLPDTSGLQEMLPIRKRFFDWLLFRSKARLRRIYLGDENPSEQPMSAAVKVRRIHAEGWLQLHEAIGFHAQETFAACLEEETRKLLREYRELFQKRIRLCLEAKSEELQNSLDSFRKEYDLRKNVIGNLDAMDRACVKFCDSVRTLEDDYVPGGRVIALPEETVNPQESETNGESMKTPANTSIRT